MLIYLYDDVLFSKLATNRITFLLNILKNDLKLK